MRTYSEADVVEMVKAQVARDGYSGTAAALGVSVTYVRLVTSGEGKPGPKVYQAMGLRRETRYVRDS